MNPLMQQLLQRQPMPPQPSDGLWAQPAPQGPPGQPPPGGPPGPPMQGPPPPGVNPQAPGQPPLGTPNLIPSGPQGQPNPALIQAMLKR